MTPTRDDYRTLIASQPELFDNPDGAAIEILLDDDAIQEAERTVAEQLREQGLPAVWATVGIAFQDQYMRVVRDAVRFSSGQLGTYIRTIPANPKVPGVIVLPMFEDSIVLVRHFRHASRQWHLEIPRGFGSAGSTPEEDARREVLEEISGQCSRVEQLGLVHLDTGIDGGHDLLFYAELSSMGAYDTDEGINKVLQVSLGDFEAMIARAEITDSFTLSAYARAKAAGLLKGP